MTGPEIPRDEAESALQARRDLGPEYEDAVVESFVDRIDATIERRIADEVQRRVGSPEIAKQQRKAEAERSGQRLALGIVSLALAIPLTAIASDQAGLGGLILVLAAIAAINVAFNLGGRRG